MSVEITQDDRNAAAALSVSRSVADIIRSGKDDGHPFVQAFAKHRSTSTEEVERLRSALQRIAVETRRQQLPITALVHEIAITALGASNHVG